MEELGKMDQINDLAFDLMHKEMNPTEQFVYADKIYQLSLQPELNENQQIVLDWLKEVYIDNDEGYFSVISYLTNPTTEEEVHDPAHIALACLNPDEEVQVLAAFAAWGMKEVAE